MCGRYTLSTPTDLLSDLYEVETELEVQPRFNIAPTQESLVIRIDPESERRRLDLLRWGLIPFWAKDPAIGNRMINARSETVAEKPAFRVSWKKKRCLVMADGFYEWRAGDGPKQPFYFHRQDGYPLALAGLWDRWDKGAEGPIETFTILTTGPDEIVAPVHKRMPVILEPETHQRWLDPSFDDLNWLASQMAPASPSILESFPVTTYVNSPAHEGPDCIRPQS